MNNKIILVEDDAALGAVTTQVLTKRGYVVVHKMTIEETLLALKAHSFDLAILDLKLTEETSLSLIPQLKSHNPQIKILVLTAYASIATAVEAIKLGADNYLPKPASVSDILAALQRDSVIKANMAEDALMSPKRLEWEHIQRVLMKNDGNISATARELNMHRRTLQRKLQKKPVRE